MSENQDRFLSEAEASIASGTFVKLTLGNYKGADERLQKLLVRLVTTSKGQRLFFLYRSDTRDTAKNYDIKKGLELIGEALDSGFHSGHLFTTTNDFQFELGRKGHSRLNTAKPTFRTVPRADHDRSKKTQIDPGSFYLRALGITDDSGRVRDREQAKWRQINKFVEILASLIEKSHLKDKKELTIVDMGSGKGYLTFAAYDHLKNERGVDVRMTGVDTKRELVDLGNDVAAASGFEGLRFVVGTIADQTVSNIDILIALHACNTATDDAIFKGIAAGAELIIAAPCCHQELRPQIKSPPLYKDILKHGVMLERTAEMLTDGLRSLLLERSGYSTKLFEFVSIEHTPKNNMLVGTRVDMLTDRSLYDRQISAIKEEFGIREQHLERLLEKPLPS